MRFESESGRRAQQATSPFSEERQRSSSRPDHHAHSDERCQTVSYKCAGRVKSIAMLAERAAPSTAARHSNRK